MKKRVLIAYGTMSGSTAGVAQAVAEVVEKEGWEVTAEPVENIKDVQGYDAIVVGTAVRMFHVLGKTRRFLRKHKKSLQNIPVAYFLVCLTMSEDTPENIEQATKFAQPMISTKEPVSLGLFGGCIDHEKMTDIFALPLKQMPEQDHRDWEKIRAWASDLVNKF